MAKKSLKEQNKGIMTYLYFCDLCGEMEIEHKMSEKIDDCPICKSKNICTKIKRLITKSQGFILCGGGWAKDNYK